MSGTEKVRRLSGDLSKENHFCTKIRHFSGRKTRSPSLSSDPSLSRSASFNKMPAFTDLLSRTSSWAHKLTAYLPNMRSASGESTDSGFHSCKQSQPSSRAESRRSSVSESEDELLSHVNVFPGMDVNQAYDLKHLLGEGAFSKVFLAESRKDSGGFAAVKIIDKEELCKDEDKMFLVDKEIEIMSQLDHPNIVRLYEVYESKTEVKLSINNPCRVTVLLGSGLPGDGAGQGRRTVRQTARARQSLRASGWQTDGSGRSTSPPA